MAGLVSPSTREVVAALQRRALKRLRAMSEQRLYGYLADVVYQERRRIDAGQASDDGTPEYEQLLDGAAHALRASRDAQEQALVALVAHYTREIHNRFSDRAYSFATRILPGALTRLLTATQPGALFGADFDPASRLVTQGPIDQLRALSQTHTLLVTPTHLSNLDSPLIGYALYAAQLPPCLYGAGLNLFSNPAMAFFMSRLGAYTVDCRKKHALYKDTLKDYSTESLRRGSHSLFFPGGTRARSGRLETDLKKGLLGTASAAWQENLAERRPGGEILIVPCTLSFSLVLEAETLIEDALAEAGKSRYIISDDEFSEPRTVASFARRVLNLDASTYVRFGAPLDLLGNPVDETGRSLGPDGAPVERRDYVTDRDGAVIWDAQRDRVYTDRLADAITAAYRRDNIALSTHVTGLVGWELLRQRFPRLDTFQLAVLRRAERQISREAFLRALERTLAGIQTRVARGVLRQELPGGGASAEAVLADALARFGGYHKQPALEAEGDQLSVGPKLSLYYGNRLRGYGLEEEVAG